MTASARDAKSPLGGGQMARSNDAMHPVYQPSDPDSVADMLSEFERKYRYRPADTLATIIAHSEMYIGVAILDCEIEHGTEYLDVLHAQRLAAISTLARREVRGYTIEADSGGFDRDYLDNLKHRASLALLLEGRGVEVQRRGRTYVARCPMPDHDDRTPSFHVYTDSNTFHCFGCGAHGDIIDLIMALDGVTFPDAVREAARLAGVDVPAPRRRRYANGGRHAR